MLDRPGVVARICFKVHMHTAKTIPSWIVNANSYPQAAKPKDRVWGPSRLALSRFRGHRVDFKKCLRANGSCLTSARCVNA